MIIDLSSFELATEMTQHQTAIAARLTEQGVTPHLAILDCERPGQHEEVGAYVRGKLAYLASVGIEATYKAVPGYELEARVRASNLDQSVHGILVEDPPYFEGLGNTPTDQALVGLLRKTYLDAIAPEKAVDGQGKWSAYRTGATATAAVRLLRRYRDLAEEHVLIVGEGSVGSGVRELVQNECQELSVVDIKHRNLDKLPGLARAATTVFVATGVPNSYGPTLVREGQAVVGIGRHDIDPRVRQITDINFALTPPKGGVGPLTIRTTAERVIESAEARLPKAA